MQLNYRGIKYEANSPVVNLNNSNPADATLRYRGNAYDTNLPVVAQAKVEAADATLQYRGNTYNAALPTIAQPSAESVASSVVEADPAPVAAVSGDRARSLMMNHHRQVKQRQQVMLSRLATSIGLDGSETAKYWNHIQGKVHPSFWATYDRSHAASS
ncbi:MULTISPECIES: DUF4278 domain-containing protein [unclassified Leptolyngbya]|uniref:DUF4278 domain-containing protein n=1 Tax=unclassified Leptolyngbya TaxID=2650499 RepID=UPI00168A0D7D|nr:MULTISPECIES: DUF4278 domain-containing protein [unclassified Leptolyngbya]MBD1910614.1 DUF4278 domain-containing protein [Leptolyngbya sp. FACHB-8]MBD2154554.1 DUF4278 domain-containing protein [Leptolyngbya sp. FACHB-16]